MRYQPTRSCGIAETFWLGRGSSRLRARDTPYEIHRLVLIAVSNEGRDAGQQAVAPAVGRSLRADPALLELVEALRGGASVVVVTDGGMPRCPTPGTALVRAAIDAGHPVTSVPGPQRR